MRRILLLAALGLAGPLAAQAVPNPRRSTGRSRARSTPSWSASTRRTRSAAPPSPPRRWRSGLLAAGLAKEDVQVLEPVARKGNLIARYRGRGASAPILLLAHIDVVEARDSDWTVAPFTLTEQDGWFYGRGTADDKAMAAIWIANLIRYKREGFVSRSRPDRGTHRRRGGWADNGAAWLLSEHPTLVRSAFVLNEGGGGARRDGKAPGQSRADDGEGLPVVRARGARPGRPQLHPAEGHPDLTASRRRCSRVQGVEFPARLNETTREYFRRMAPLEPGTLGNAMAAIARDPGDPAALATLDAEPLTHAIIRTTCVATLMEAATPQCAAAAGTRHVNCRLLPGGAPEDVRPRSHAPSTTRALPSR
jgi:hypothetical protein